MKIAGALLFLIPAGPGLLTLGFVTLLRGTWRESVPLLEVIIDRAAGIEPPARSAWDRRFALVQAWMFVAIGTVFSLGLALILFSFVPE